MAITAGSNLNSVPATVQQALASNYIDFTATATAGWAQQYLPDLMEKEAEVFGPRTISGFLSQVGAEEAMTSDQVVWSEQGRLHLAYTCSMIDADQGMSGDNPGCEIEILLDMDGKDPGSNHGVRVNDTVIVAGGTGATFKGLVTQVNGTNIEVANYEDADAASGIADGTDNCTILVYGSEFGKGRSYMTEDGYTTAGAYGTATEQRGGNEPKFTSFSNKPIILKDYYAVSGSDASKIGWVEVTAEDGTSG